MPVILKRFNADRAFWTVVEVSGAVLDAVHVASAQLFAARTASAAFVFVRADMRQTTAAAALGMTIRHVES